MQEQNATYRGLFHRTEAAALFDADAYAEMLAILESAQRSIRLTFYLFGGPDADRMAEVLAAKQAHGVSVRVLLDRKVGVGPTLPSVLQECQKTYRKLKRLGIDVRLSRPGAVSHHKYIVADEAEALLGGMNVGTLFRRYHDLMLRVSGPVAADLARRFDAEWGGETPTQTVRDDAAPFAGMVPSFSGPARARVVGTGPGERTTLAALTQNLQRAQRTVDVALCEIGRTALLGELIACHNRGAFVRVLLDPQITAPIGPSGLLNAGAVQTLLDAGIAVHLYTLGRDFMRLHLKMAVFDGESAVAGSTNWTRGGFEWVGETDLELHGGAAIAQLAAQFEADWSRSTPASPPTQTAHFLHNLYERYARWI